MNIIKKIIKYLDEFILTLTKLLHALIPIILILGGAGGVIGVPILWYLKQNIVLSQLFYIIIFLVIIWIGFKWITITQGPK